jgi:Flp pilus assembly pilin Flp
VRLLRRTLKFHLKTFGVFLVPSAALSLLAFLLAVAIVGLLLAPAGANDNVFTGALVGFLFFAFLTFAFAFAERLSPPLLHAEVKKGPDLIEYALLAALITVLTIALLMVLGPAIKTLFDTVGPGRCPEGSRCL